MLRILRYSCFVCLFVFFVVVVVFCFLCYFVFFFFIQNLVDLTISRIKKELDLHVGSNGGLKKDCKVILLLLLLLSFTCTGCLYICYLS